MPEAAHEDDSATISNGNIPQIRVVFLAEVEAYSAIFG